MSESSKLMQKPTHHNCDTCDVRHKAMCAAVDAEHTDQLRAIVSHRDYAPGQVIFEEGDPADYAFNISAGEVRLCKLLPDGRRQVTGFLTPGDFLGLIADSAYAYGAEAIGQVELCCIQLSNLERLLSDIPPVREKLLSMSRDELAAAQEQMLLLGRKTAREKIVSFLLYRHKHLGRTEGDASIDLPMSRVDIADYLGLTIETVSRTFTALREEGLIELPHPHHVIFPNLDAVRDAAEAG
ncbi:MAG: cyclic nucleotide-binding domain-containing protein [Proteobacteria bacterium]|nr:cyclic nucleotide-binding domain-containing protein [Pseudomonadota bacterium]